MLLVVLDLIYDEKGENHKKVELYLLVLVYQYSMKEVRKVEMLKAVIQAATRRVLVKYNDIRE